MDAVTHRNITKEDREEQLQYMDAKELWSVLQNKHGKKMPDPDLFDENAHVYLRARFIKAILEIEYGC